MRQKRRRNPPDGSDAIAIFDRFGPFDIEVPDPAIEPGPGREDRLGTSPALGEIAFAIEVLRTIRARKAAHDIARLVLDLERHRTFGRGAEPIIDHRALRRVLADRGFGRERGIVIIVEANVRRGGRGEQMCRFGGQFGLKLAQKRKIAEDPDRPALRRCDQVIALDQKIARPGGRQILLQWLPPVAIVETDEHAGFGAGVKQARAHRVGAHDADRLAGGKARGDVLPGLAAIVRPQDMGFEIVDPLAIDRKIGGIAVAIGLVDARNLAPRLHSGERARLPAAPAVARDAEDAAVAARPDFVGRMGRRLDRYDRPVAASSGVGDRDRIDAARRIGLLAGKVGADDRPAVAAVERSENDVAAKIQRIGPGPRRDQRIDPVEMMLDRGRAKAVIGHRERRDVGDIAGIGVPPADVPAKSRTIDDAGVLRVGNVVIALVAADRMPVAEIGRSIIASAGDRDGPAVLLARVNPIGKAVVGREVIELAGRLIIPVAPGLRAVDADCSALVRRRRNAFGMERVDPEVVIIVAAGTAAGDHAMHPALIAAADRLADGIDHVGVARIDRDPACVIRGEGLFVIDLAPMRAAVVAAPHPAILLRIHHRIDPQCAVLAGRCEADPADRAVGPAAAGQPLPVGAAIVAAPHPAARPRGLGEIALPRPLPPFPGRGEERFIIGRIAGDIDRAGEAAGRKRMSPGPAAVGRTIDAARIAGAEEMADRGDDDVIGILGIDPDLADIFGVVKAEVGPVFAAVAAAIDAAPGLDVIARLGLAGAGVDHLGIGRRHGNRADGRAWPMVEHAAPRAAAVVGFPDAPARCAKVKGVGFARSARNDRRPAGAERPQFAPLQHLRQARVDGSSGNRRSNQRAGEKKPKN